MERPSSFDGVKIIQSLLNSAGALWDLHSILLSLSDYFTSTKVLLLKLGCINWCYFLVYSSCFSLFTCFICFFSCQFIKPRNTIYSNYTAFTAKAFHWTQLHQLYYFKADHWFRSVQYKWHKQTDWWLCSWMGPKKCRNKLCVSTECFIDCVPLTVLFPTIYTFFNLDQYGK